MTTPTAPGTPDELLSHLRGIVERIAADGDLTAVGPLLSLTSTHTAPPLLASLAESFARMLVKLEAREYELECTIADLRTAKQALELANHDPLTGLPNRVIARDRLQQGLRQAQRQTGGQGPTAQLAVLYMDLDKFKWVNDHLGHPAGDELLQQVAARCSACIRESDTLARLGGDEFLCVLPSLSGLPAAEELAQRLVDALNQPFQLRDGEARIGTSVGIALYPSHGDTPEQLVAAADAALYAAKHAGRNVYRVYSPG